MRSTSCKTYSSCGDNHPNLLPEKFAAPDEGGGLIGHSGGYQHAFMADRHDHMVFDAVEARLRYGNGAVIVFIEMSDETAESQRNVSCDHADITIGTYVACPVIGGLLQHTFGQGFADDVLGPVQLTQDATGT